MTEINIQEQQHLKYLLQQGIPKPFLKKSLNNYGPTGKQLAEILSNATEYEEFLKQNKVINLIGDDRATDLLYSLCRGLMLLGHHGYVDGLGWLRTMQVDEFSLLDEITVLGITDFFESDFVEVPFDKTQIYTIEKAVKYFIKQGGTLVISSSSTISKFNQWYSFPFVSLLARQSREFIYDTGD